MCLLHDEGAGRDTMDDRSSVAVGQQPFHAGAYHRRNRPLAALNDRGEVRRPYQGKCDLRGVEFREGGGPVLFAIARDTVPWWVRSVKARKGKLLLV